jgi:hypothetical protein
MYFLNFNPITTLAHCGMVRVQVVDKEKDLGLQGVDAKLPKRNRG